MILIVLLNALFAASFTLGKLVLDYTKPLFFVGSSMCIGGSLLLAYQYFFAPEKLKIKKEDWKYFIQVSVFTVLLSYGLQYWGMQYMPSFKVCFLYNSGPFTSYLIAYFLFNERMILKKWLGLFIGFIGLIPVLISSTPGEQLSSGIFFISIPEIAVILSAAAYAYGWFVIKILVHDKGYSTFTVNGFSMITGGLMTLATVPYIEGGIYVEDFFPFFLLLTVTIIIEYLICNNLYAYLLNRYSETFLSFAAFLNPVFGGLYGWLFLQEYISWHFFASCAIISVAIALFYKAEMQLNPDHHARD